MVLLEETVVGLSGKNRLEFVSHLAQRKPVIACDWMQGSFENQHEQVCGEVCRLRGCDCILENKT